MSSDRSSWETGDVVAGLRDLPLAPYPRGVTWSHLGPGSFKSRSGRVNGILVRAVLTDGRLDVATSPRWVGGLLGARTFSCRPGADVVAYPARAMFGLRGIGVASGDDDAVLVTWDRVATLRTLAAAGFAVSPGERVIRYL